MIAWTIEDAIQFCRALEDAIAPVGFHVGLRGGVLLRGKSDRDLDLVIYPHDSSDVHLDRLRDRLRSFGLKQVESTAQVHARWQARGTTDRKAIEIWEFGGRIIDLLVVRSP